MVKSCTCKLATLLIDTEPLPALLKASSTIPDAKVMSPWVVPLLPPMISLAFPSPGYHATIRKGGATQPACDCEPNRVAVAVTTVSPVAFAGRGNVNGPKVAPQLASLVTLVEPRKCFPCPLRNGEHVGLVKNSRRNAVLATLS